MKKSARILVSLMSLLVFMSCLPCVAAADKQMDPPPMAEGTAYLDMQNGIEINLHETAGTSSSLIKQWNCAIGENSNRKVSISGETITYEAVDYLDVEVFLQCWNGSDWVNVTSRIYKNRDSFYVSGSDFITVSKGYSYRCKAIHTARTAGSNDHIKTSVSNAIMIQ